MKLFTGLLCAVLFMVIGTTTNAQTPYTISNSTPVPVNGFFVQTTCGVIGPLNLAPATTVTIIIPPGCFPGGIVFRGAFFGIGYNGPVPPPNPPNGINVTGTGATFW